MAQHTTRAHTPARLNLPLACAMRPIQEWELKDYAKAIWWFLKMCWLGNVRDVINLGLGTMVSHGDCVCDINYPLCSWRSGICLTPSGKKPSLSTTCGGGYNGEYCYYSNAYTWSFVFFFIAALTNAYVVERVEKGIIFAWNFLVQLKEDFKQHLREQEAQRRQEEYYRQHRQMFRMLYE